MIHETCLHTFILIKLTGYTGGVTFQNVKDTCKLKCYAKLLVDISKALTNCSLRFKILGKYHYFS